MLFLLQTLDIVDPGYPTSDNFAYPVKDQWLGCFFFIKLVFPWHLSRFFLSPLLPSCILCQSVSLTSSTGTMSEHDAVQTHRSGNPREGTFGSYMRKTGRYALTRLPTLVPPMNPAPNPLKALSLLNREQWLFFSVGLPPGHACMQSQTANTNDF